MTKKLKTSAILAVTALSAVSALAGCKGKDDPVYFSFSIGMSSGASIIELDSDREEYISVYDNGVDTAGRSYIYESSDESVATIDEDGKITPVGEGYVNFMVTEEKSDDVKQLAKEIHVVKKATDSKGGFNYAGGSSAEDLEKRAEILGKLEKYAMDTHLTGITLFDNGGYVKYSERVQLPVTEYIEGYGFGLLTEGSLDPDKPLKGTDGGTSYPTYLHESIAQDSLKINQFTATGSQVGDLASYITSTYWGTRLSGVDSYEWYPQLATDEVYYPTVTGYKEEEVEGKKKNVPIISYSEKKVVNNEPIPMEVDNATHLFKKWRIYVKTDGDVNNSVLKFHTKSQSLKEKGFDNRGVTIDDYEFVYKFLFTQSNNMIRGTEMANDSSYGIKGAQRFFNETATAMSAEDLNSKWEQYKKDDKIGIHTGTDINGEYLDIELVNAIDSFTAMYTLSSSLVSPLPEDLFVGPKAIQSTMKDSAQKYGTFNNGGNDAILNYTICCGPFSLEKWTKDQEIVFARNDDWLDYKTPSGELTGRYNIPGVYYRKIDTSTDTEKNWKQLEAGNLDAAGVPSKKVKDFKDADGVKPTKGDSTFKLNVNSCTEDEWKKLFWDSSIDPEKFITKAKSQWDVKPWMSNGNFLDGLFYSIDRKAFAEKRGVTPSINYFSDAYMMRNAEGGSSYNKTQAHKDAVRGYESNPGEEDTDYGYDFDKAVDCFRAAVKELSDNGGLVLGSKSDPTTISIHIRWMYQTDIKEYGEDIKYYFEKAFNNNAVCGGRVKLEVKQEAVTNWEDVYNEWMMQGRFDLAFGAISGNTYNPLNFMEVLKSDNSSSFTLNWGTDTSEVDENNPIIYDGKKWSFDGLWEVADHGGIVDKGVKIKPVKSCYCEPAYVLGSTDKTKQKNLYEGFKLVVPVEFAEFNEEGSGKVDFDFSRLDVYVVGRGNITLSEDKACYDKVNHVITVEVPKELAQEINEAIIKANGFKETDKDEWHKNPFLQSKLGDLFAYELYYTITIGGSSSENYAEVKTSKN